MHKNCNLYINFFQIRKYSNVQENTVMLNFSRTLSKLVKRQINMIRELIDIKSIRIINFFASLVSNFYHLSSIRIEYLEM